MRVVIAGGTGFIGKLLTDFLVSQGHEVVILTRNKKTNTRKISYVRWLRDDSEPESKIGDVDTVINLAGVSINAGRWSEKHQKAIYESRIEATSELLRIIQEMENKPTTFINASAIGIYPASLNKVYQENTTEQADDFLGKTVKDWEVKAKEIEKMNIRTVFMRFGVVLGKDNGALPLMVLPYKLFVGGTVGSGKQWISWVHVEDLIRAISFVIENESISGPVNVTAPTPVQMRNFGLTISQVLKRPHWLPTPAFLLKLVLGKKSQLVLEGQNVIPQVLIDAGFEFKYPQLELALKDLLIKT